MSTEFLPCNVVVELLTDYIEGALDADTAARVEEHLAVCPPCVTYLEQIRATIASLGRLQPDTLSDEALTELQAAFGKFHRAR